MNESIFWETMELDGRWDHGQGWVSLNIPDKEWRLRLAGNLFQNFPESPSL
ncbi:MAG: hypothetical protein SH817_05840 [Leptospira sp.]|nr:hypothetical protein [Leptospira sp.]